MQYPRYHKYEAGCFLSVSGPDARSFLQGQFSMDLSQVGRGGLAYGLWLDRKGKVLADSFALCLGDEEFALLSYHCDEETVFQRLDAYLIMEEAELIRSSGKRQALSVWGESAQAAVCSALGFDVPAKGGFSSDAGALAFWGRRSEEPVLEIFYLDEACIDKLDAVLAGLDGQELSEIDLRRMAIESMTPQIGSGFGEADLPQELGLDREAVSFQKGCYLGQEVMARLKAMGKVRKGLKLLSICETDTVSPDALPLDLLDETGKRQGQLRVLASSEAGAIGLGIVSSSFSGAYLLAAGAKVKIVEKGSLRNG